MYFTEDFMGEQIQGFALRLLNHPPKERSPPAPFGSFILVSVSSSYPLSWASLTPAAHLTTPGLIWSPLAT